MKKIHQDVWCGCILLALVAFAFATSRGFARFDARSIVMPYIAMAIITLLALIIIIQGIQKSVEAAKKNEVPKQFFTLQNMKIPMITFGIIAAYILLFHYVGYMIATALFLVALMWFFKMRNWKTILAIVIVYLLIVYFGFYRGLHVNVFNLGELQYIFR